MAAGLGEDKARTWDLLVVGAGPAGLTAAIYGARAGLATAVLERGQPGGQVAAVERIENYPGFPEGVEGVELAMRMQEQARRFGAAFLAGDAGRDGLDLASTVKTVAGHRARAVILATGVRPRKLGIPGEDRLAGRGVSYCATCDGPLFRGRRVAVVGGGDSAVTEALYLARLASEVALVHRRDRFRAAKTLVERLRKAPNVRFELERVPLEIAGEERVQGLVIGEAGGGASVRLEVDGVFIYAGLEPETGFVRGQVDLDAHGYVITDEAMRTRVPGVYAAGDVRAKETRQVVTAAADGALAAVNAEKDMTGA